MRISIERIRLWIVIAAVLLVIAIAGFLGYARYRIRQVAHDLPAKLGLQIQTSTNGFTVSRSKAGHTLFVLHAAKAIQFKGGGHLVLHDVSILMYGKDGSQSDRMSGSQFDYDQGTGIARADGSVDIEITQPIADAGHLSGKLPTKTPTGPIHVKTSGLVFDQKKQLATTDQGLTFQEADSSGSARGATFDGENGTLVLAHDVILNTQVASDSGKDPVTIKAQSASFNRALRQLIFISSLTDYQQDHATADESTIFFRPDGSAEHLVAQGHIHIVSDKGSDLKSSNAYAQLDAKSQLQQLRLEGGVLLIAHNDNQSNVGQKNAGGLRALQTIHADSDTGILTFNKNQLEHLQLAQAVSIVDQQVGLPGDPNGSETREVRAAKLDVSFAPGPDGRAEAKSALAKGEAIMTVHTIHAAAEQQSTTLRGDQLFATLVGGHQLSSLRGDGNTFLLQNSPGGVSQTSSADSLLVNFAPATSTPGKAAAKQAASTPGSQVASAVQQGHAQLAQLQPSKTPGAPPDKTTASADRIAYDGASGKIALSGGAPHINKDGSDLTAATIEFNRTSGDATAAGSVKATYSAGAASVTHVISDRASLVHSTDETTFTGTVDNAARLWNGPNSITAPTLVLSRTLQLLTAKGPANSVKATFATGPSTHSSQPSDPKQSSKQPSVLRITSGSLVYSGGERKATFSSGVLAQGSEGVMHASALDVFLAPERAAGNSKSSPTPQPKSGPPQLLGPSGQVDRIVATGHVDLQQGDRKCTGDKLVYTADDQHFVLTGTAGAPPRVTDPAHGTVTGGALIFNNRDDSVVVSRGQSATVTDTHTPR